MAARTQRDVQHAQAKHKDWRGIWADIGPNASPNLVFATFVIPACTGMTGHM
jgi:hypothetical protein